MRCVEESSCQILLAAKVLATRMHFRRDNIALLNPNYAVSEA